MIVRVGFNGVLVVRVDATFAAVVNGVVVLVAGVVVKVVVLVKVCAEETVAGVVMVNVAIGLV